MKIDPVELTAFIKSVIQAVDSSKNREMVLQSGIEFELSVVTTKEGSGGIKIFIANAGGKYEKETSSRIKFTVGYTKKTNTRITNG